MSSSQGTNTFVNFYQQVHKVMTTEPFASRFKELSRAGNKQGMVDIIFQIPCAMETRIDESYRAKNDLQALDLYERSLKIMTEKGDKTKEEINASHILTNALFAASAHSSIFLDTLLERARRWYNLGAFAKCLKDCECMLALFANFYDESVEDTAKYYSECRKQCLHLENECSRKLQTYRRKKLPRGKGSIRGNDKASMTQCIAATPAVDGKQNSRLESCSDAISQRFNKQKGRYLVANRDIQAGSVLIVDRPFSFSTDEDALDRNCLHCHASLQFEDSVKIPCRNCQTVSFCTETCRKAAWQMYHKYECTVFNFFFESNSDQRRQTSYLLLAYRTTIAAMLSLKDEKHDDVAETQIKIPLSSEFLQSRNTEKDKDVKTNAERTSTMVESKKLYRALDYQTVLRLETHCADVEPNINLIRAIEAAFLAKCLIFSLNKAENNSSLKEDLTALAVSMLHHLQVTNCNAYEIVENVRNEVARVWEPRNVGGALYTTVSLVNHSCYPNVVRHSYTSGMVVVRTLRFICKGNEILDCYGPHFIIGEKLARQEYLWKKYCFICACDACSNDWKFPLLESITYRCRACSFSLTAANDSITRCPQCREKFDYKKLNKQLHRSIEKRLSAISKMYQGYYEEALTLLLDHSLFIDQFLVTPNIESIKTQQSLIQCYNSFGCISVK